MGDDYAPLVPRKCEVDDILSPQLVGFRYREYIDPSLAESAYNRPRNMFVSVIANFTHRGGCLFFSLEGKN